MSSRQFHLHNGQKGSALAIRVIPRATRNEITEILEDGTVKIRLVSPPVEEKSNDVLLEFLAAVLQVPRSRLEVVAGENGRDKLVSVLDLDANDVHQRILKNIQKADPSH